MTLQYLPNEHIHDNPYQTRVVAPLSVTDLVESFKERGMLTVPTARPHPTTPGHVQLIEGHRRRCAWFIALPDEYMPVEVKDGVSDRDMFELNVIENSQRAELNDMEKARQMQAYIANFNVSQADAGKLFNLKTQGAVSNLLRLLALPPELQVRIITGHLPQRIARTLIIPARIEPKRIISIVEKAFSHHEPSDEGRAKAVEEIEEEVGEWVWKTGKRVDHFPWDADAKHKIQIDGVDETARCNGCASNIKSNYGYPMCMRPQCMEAVAQLYSEAQLKKAVKHTGIPALKSSEQCSLVWDGDHPVHIAQELVNKKLTHLRLRIAGDGGWKEGNRQEVLGAKRVALVTVDLDWLAAFKAKAQTGTSKQEAEQAREQAKREKRKFEANQCTQVVKNIAPLFAAALPYMPSAFENEVAKLFFQSFDDGSTESYSELIRLPLPKRRVAMMQAFLFNKCVGGWYSFTTIAAFEKRVVEMARDYKVKLPKKWNQLAPTAPATNGKAKPGGKGKKK